MITKAAASRWREYMKNLSQEDQRKFLRNIGLNRAKPQLAYPELQPQGRAMNLPEFMNAIPLGVRVDRPYPEWAAQIAQHPELASLQPTKMLGLGADALAMQLRDGRVLKLSTRPFGQTQFDIPTQHLKTIEVPVHHKARQGVLHAGIQPLADVGEVRQNLTALAHLHKGMANQGMMPSEFKLENFGHVGGKPVIIDPASAVKVDKPESPVTQVMGQHRDLWHFIFGDKPTPNFPDASPLPQPAIPPVSAQTKLGQLGQVVRQYGKD